MESKDTLGNISTSNSNESVFFIIVIIVLVVVLYLSFSKKTLKPIENVEIKTLPETIEKVTSVELEESEDHSTIVPVSESDKSLIEISIKEIIKEPQPIIEGKIAEVLVVKEEEQTTEKYIGYNPINLFAQSEPLHFPYVLMPKPNCVIKFPRKGRTGRKGFKEEAFKEYIVKHFKSDCQIFDDRFILVKNNTRPFEPDFTLINEKNGINIFVDIEIDEPYEGTNDIENRKPTHYKYSDTNRNNAFTNRGWIVIRFAEIQVHQQPDLCCKFIADVLKSIHSNFKIPEKLQLANTIQYIPQWTEDEARQWSLDKYRENYLGIEQFGITSNDKSLVDIEETELGETIEKQVQDDEIKEITVSKVELNSFQKLLIASVGGKYVSCKIGGEKIIFKPTYLYDHETSGFCYIKNVVKTYKIVEIESVEIKDNYFTSRHYLKQSNNITEISKIINAAIRQKKTIRIVYTKPGHNFTNIDLETGEIIERVILPEESERTLSNIDLSINILSKEHIESYRLDENYVSGYCNTRKEIRTFKFNRIGKIEILDL